MMFTILFIVWLIATSNITAKSIGVVYHTSLITSNSNMTINRLNCEECLCTMYTSSIFSLNCFTNNSYGVTCQLFLDGIYLGLNNSQMKINLNSTFYFRMKAQSETTTAQMMTNTPVTSSAGITYNSAIIPTTTPVCSAVGRGMLNSLNLSTPANWTEYSYNYTASSTTLTLIFGFQTGSGCSYYLDDVSVIDVKASSIQLLNNPSFENSTTIPDGWMVWCTTSCDNTDTKVISNSQCHLSAGTCLKVGCHNSVSFVGQSFSVVIGHIYTISYWLMIRGCDSPSNHFYADLY